MQKYTRYMFNCAKLYFFAAHFLDQKFAKNKLIAKLCARAKNFGSFFKKLNLICLYMFGVCLKLFKIAIVIN